MARKRTYDAETYNLACYFLEDISQGIPAAANAADSLARAIQDAIEDWLEEHPEHNKIGG